MKTFRFFQNLPYKKQYRKILLNLFAALKSARLKVLQLLCYFKLWVKEKKQLVIQRLFKLITIFGYIFIIFIISGILYFIILSSGDFFKSIRLLSIGKVNEFQVEYVKKEYVADLKFVYTIKLKGINRELYFPNALNIKSDDKIKVLYSPKFDYWIYVGEKYNFMDFILQDSIDRLFLNIIFLFLFIMSLKYSFNKTFISFRYVSHLSKKAFDENFGKYDKKIRKWLYPIHTTLNILPSFQSLLIILITVFALVKIAISVEVYNSFTTGVVVLLCLLLITFLPSHIVQFIYTVKRSNKPLFVAIRSVIQILLFTMALIVLFRFLIQTNLTEEKNICSAITKFFNVLIK